VGAAAAVGIPLNAQGHFYPGTVVAGLDLGGKSEAAGAQLLRSHFAGFEQTAVTFELDGKTWQASLADLGFGIDYDTTLNNAFQHGRADGVVNRYTTWLQVGSDQQTFGLWFTRDDDQLDAYLSQLASEVEVAPVDATLVQDGSSVEVTPDVDGATLDVASVRAQVIAEVQQATSATISLGMLPVGAKVTADRLSSVRDDAATLLEGPVTIVSGESSWSVDVDTLASALVIPDDPTSEKPSLDPNALVDAVSSIADALYVAPVNAIVGWDNGPYAVKLGSYGQWVNSLALATSVATAAADESRTAQVPVTDVLPDVRSDNLDTLGLEGLIAQGDSSFSGSGEARQTNVLVAAEHVSHTLIAPGEQFSFNQSLGLISVDNGYVEGKIIQGQWYASDIGGGVCQVSTTVYRAALLAGISFDEWHAHSFRVSFYELDGWPPGIDAAIYQPNYDGEWELDLKFTNPTDSWMLLQMVQSGESIVAQLYGTSLGYDVTLSDPDISDPIEPGDPIERESTELAAGQKQVVQQASPGYNVTLVRTITHDGEVVSQDTFVSNYQAQSEVIEVGTASTSA